MWRAEVRSEKRKNFPEALERDVSRSVALFSSEAPHDIGGNVLARAADEVGEGELPNRRMSEKVSTVSMASVDMAEDAAEPGFWKDPFGWYAVKSVRRPRTMFASSWFVIILLTAAGMPMFEQTPNSNYDWLLGKNEVVSNSYALSKAQEQTSLYNPPRGAFGAADRPAPPLHVRGQGRRLQPPEARVSSADARHREDLLHRPRVRHLLRRGSRRRQHLQGDLDRARS